jgi:Mor family transcriptional regulator
MNREGKGVEKDDIYDELVELVGPEAAQSIFDRYQGSSVYFPRGVSIMRLHRKIREEFKNGASYMELARRYGYIERHIRRIVHKKGFLPKPGRDAFQSPEGSPKKNLDSGSQMGLW